MGINGIQLTLSGNESVETFMNFYSRGAQTELPLYSSLLMWIVGFLQILSGAVLIFALAKGEFWLNSESKFLRWALLTSIFSLVVYGLAVRMISNHQAAAMLFFYTGLMYALLAYVEYKSKSEDTVFDKIKTIPIFLTLIYTMGQPGFQKLFNASQVIPNYVRMFDGSILAQMPGGIPPFIYLLGVLEFIVPIILLISLVKGEFLPGKSNLFFSIATLVTITTFVMLSFGLSILTNVPGANNLIFYAIFTLGFHYYIDSQGKEVR